MGYLYTLKKAHIKKGHDWSAALDLELQEAKKSVARGMGPSKKADTIPLEMLNGLPDTWDSPLEADGPERPRDTVWVGSWWGMRELELASVRMGAVAFTTPGKGCGTCTINLPVSKTDVMALGKRRTHGFCCGDGVICCPVRAARNLVMCQEGRPGLLNHHRPIVSTAGGNPVSKIGIQKCL